MENEIMNELSVTFDSPITQEQLDIITDANFEKTKEVYFNTKEGDTIAFVRKKVGWWIKQEMAAVKETLYFCSECCWGSWFAYNYCPNCGAEMQREKPENCT